MTIRLINCWVVDATSPQPRQAEVVIDGPVIKEVHTGSVGDAQLSSSTQQVYDLSGAYLLPGLYDCHTHPGALIESPPDAMLLMAFESEAERTLRAARNCMDALAIGFTGLRTAGEACYIDVALRDAFANGTLVGPRLWASGPPLKITGGHGARRRRAPVYLYAPVEAPFPAAEFWGGMEVDGADAFRRAVRLNLKMGVDWIKLMATGGIAGVRESMDEPQMTHDEIEAVTMTAHAKGVKVCAHCGSAAAAKVAIMAGLDCIEHGYQLDREVVDLMADRGTYLVPTLIVTQDQEMMEKYEWSATGISRALTGAQRHRESFQMALEAGVKIATGADWSPIADAAPRELEWMARCGMSAHQVIRASTLTAAELCGVEEMLGTVEEGKLADLVVVGANPLDDISNLRQVRMVLKEGQVVNNPAGYAPVRD